MTVATYVQPDKVARAAEPSQYAADIDAATAVMANVAAAFAPHASATPDEFFIVDGGNIHYAGNVLVIAPQSFGYTGSFPAAGNHRIDRFVIDQQTGTLERVIGTPDILANPITAPVIPAGKIPVSQVFLLDTDAVVANSMITDERCFYSSSIINAETVVTANTKTSIDFTGIPAWARKITLLIYDVSYNTSAGKFELQVGDSGGLASAGYNYNNNEISGGTPTLSNSRAFGAASIDMGNIYEGANQWNGKIELLNISGNNWVISWGIYDWFNGRSKFGYGSKSLSLTLDRVRLFTTLQWDAGLVNIFYE